MKKPSQDYARLFSLIDSDGVTHLVDYTRIGLDTFVQATYPQPNIRYDLINGPGADPYSGLDQFDRVADCRWWNITTTTDVERIKHNYDRADNRLTRENTVAKAQSPPVYLDEHYSYDGMYELARLDRGQLNASKTAIQAGTLDFAQAWGLDATGNWSNFDQDSAGAGSWDLVQTRAHSKFNEIQAITGGGWVQPAYDAAGNMVSMPQPAAPAAGFSGVYDAWNRLVSVWSGGSPVAVYRFDGLNRRVSKFVSSVLRDIFYSTAWQAIEERLGGSTTPDRQFVWGLRYIDDLALRDRGTERIFGIQDPNWNLTAIVDVTGAIQERYSYTGYGLPTVLLASFAVRGATSYHWETRFGGYRWDSESGLYDNRYRPYSALLGVWLRRDPLGLELDAMREHAYAYARGNPVRFVDPSGLQAAAAMPCHDCECHKCTVLMDGRDVIDVPGNRKCRVEITCQTGDCNGLPGYTDPPTLEKDAEGNPQWVIPICVQCGWHPANLIIEHELIHALQFCRGDKITNCASCKKLETEAHKRNCELAFPGDDMKIERCYKCGVNISCKAKCKNVVPYPGVPDCTFKDLGVTQD